MLNPAEDPAYRGRSRRHRREPGRNREIWQRISTLRICPGLGSNGWVRSSILGAVGLVGLVGLGLAADGGCHCVEVVVEDMLTFLLYRKCSYSGKKPSKRYGYSCQSAFDIETINHGG